MSLSESKDSAARPEAVMRNAFPFLSEATGQLCSTPHYGVLASALATGEGTPTRYDYVLNLCTNLLELKRAVRGLGLGVDENFSGCTADWNSLQVYSGLEVCQSWAILLNAGHLFGTFATERPLLFELDRTLPYRDTFVEITAGWDSEASAPLRAHVETELDGGRLQSFHYLLALWRLREGGITKLTAGHRKHAGLLVKAFMMPPNPKVHALREIFRRVRILTYLQMHSRLHQRPYRFESIAAADLAELFPTDAVPETDWRASARWQVFRAVEAYDTETLFSSADVAAEVLGHLGEFRTWWERSGTLTFEARLDLLFARPETWPVMERKALTHYSELRVPSSVSWIHEVRHWMNDDEAHNPWGETEFFVTPPAIEDQPLRIDLFGPPEGIPSRVFEHVVVQLTRPFAIGGTSKQHHALWISTARLVAKLFETLLKPEFNLRMRHVEAAAGHAGYAAAGSTYEFVRGRIKGFLPRMRDRQRAQELRQLLWVADDLAIWRRPVVAVLATAEVVRSSKERTDVCAEIDGLLGYFENGELRWVVLETKKSGVRGGDKQLERNLFPCLLEVPKSTSIVTRSEGTEEVWYAVLNSPARLVRSDSPDEQAQTQTRPVELMLELD